MSTVQKENNHIEIPLTGKLVKEDYELVQLVDCCLYVLPSNSNLNNDLVQKNFNKVFSSDDNFINQYDLEFLETLPRMDNHLKLSSVISEGNYNLIMGMNEPGAVSGKKYLLLQSSDNSLGNDMATILKVAEQFTAKSVKKMMFRHAITSSDSFIRSTEHIWKSDGFFEKIIAHHLRSLVGDAGMCFSLDFRGGESLGNILTHSKRIEMQNKFIENVLALKKNENDEIARKEVKIVLESMSVNEIITYLQDMTDNEIKHFYNKITPVKLAERSNMKIEVRKIGRVSVKKPTDGKYRLYLQKNGVDKQVHFKRKSSFVLYLIYLMDIYKSESVDTLDIEKDYKNIFCALYDETYHYGGINSFKTMFGKGSSEQELLRHYLSDIRTSIGNVCEILHEAASPYILKDSKSHLCILKQNIIIDKNLTEIIEML